MGRQINPKKLLNSKWTAVKPVSKEKHFIVVKVHVDELFNVTHCDLEAVINKRAETIAWKALLDQNQWHQGWQ